MRFLAFIRFQSNRHQWEVPEFLFVINYARSCLKNWILDDSERSRSKYSGWTCACDVYETPALRTQIRKIFFGYMVWFGLSWRSYFSELILHFFFDVLLSIFRRSRTTKFIKRNNQYFCHCRLWTARPLMCIQRIDFDGESDSNTVQPSINHINFLYELCEH